MSELISHQDLAEASTLKLLKKEVFAQALMRFLKLEQINTIYSNISDTDDVLDFIDRVFEEIGVSFHISSEMLDRIPKEGAFITISNHPYGGIDGLILLRILCERRPDFKLMANFLLEKIEPLRENILPVNPFSQDLSKESSIKSMRAALENLQNGHPIGIFPAGEVSSLHKRQVTDKQWNKSAIKLIQQANVPIVPIYFDGKNSIYFQVLGLINPLLRTVKLPSEFLNKQGKPVEVRIGKPISVKEQSAFVDHNRFSRYIRSKTYALGTTIEVKRFFQNDIFPSKTAEPVQAAQPMARIVQEAEKLDKHYKIFDSSQFSIFCAPSSAIPTMLQEIGRLRELTFRAVGEGTNRACDLDEFDIYYHHLIIWDREKNRIVGGYRIGKGEEIMQAFGVRGFYIHQLFKIKRPIQPILFQSLELGRSFIVKEYQRQPLPLFLLWKGILVFLLKNPSYRYLTGPVSISNQFSGFSKGILIEFLKRNYFHEEYAQHIKPRKAFKPKSKAIDIDILLESSQKDLSKLDKLIQEIEPMGLNLPVLFKKYIKQNAKLIGFNIDPKFNDALDGLMLLDIYDVPSSTIVSLMKEFENEELTAALTARNLVA